MAHRMQITLDDRQYERLRAEAERTGASIAELVRRAVDARYGAELTLDEKLRILDATSGALER
jgi:Ribbon-helix-helix protein, copG family